MKNFIIFKKACIFLKENSNCNYPIKIRRLTLSKKYDGLCVFKQDYFLIKLNRFLDEEHMIDILIHEIAHAMSWGLDKDYHGPNWGLAYSKIYRKFLKDFIPTIKK